MSRELKDSPQTEKICVFAKDTSDKWLLSKIYEEYLKFNTKETTD